MKRNRCVFFCVLILLQLACGSVQAKTGNPRVNQIGYLPQSVKIATYKTSDIQPQEWMLTQGGKVVARGQTSIGKLDAGSGDTVQQIDFSGVTATGSGFAISVGKNASYPFNISNGAFRASLYDALKYFYHNRSGIEILEQYTGGGLTSYLSHPRWARPAGHLNQGDNQGDLRVPCWAGTCDYALDVPKGWYDAGDHGKYVVNGGISVWTLLNLFERAYFWGNTERLGDGKLNIPESDNGVPDLLDEVRWELEFMLSMQVPAGQPKAGMVHHKVHDVRWTGLPLAPDRDPQPRALAPPSTAATLNLAATVAQAARIWKSYDPTFAARCLQAAKTAWDAALRNPKDLYLGGYDTGGGADEEATVSDEFYWAAVELYLTTSDKKYLPFIDAFTIARDNFYWANTELAGLISLATVDMPNSAGRRKLAQQRILVLADKHLATQSESGYSTPLDASEYGWGSNSAVTNKLMLMGLAYTFSKQRRFADGVTKGVDYLFGRNTFSTSFVTGAGTNSVKYPHHRFWAAVLSPEFPFAPPGALSGGPNSKLDDPVSKIQLMHCAKKPATCWIDDINAYSVNEITINWNAPLAWLLDFQNGLAEVGTAERLSVK